MYHTCWRTKYIARHSYSSNGEVFDLSLLVVSALGITFLRPGRMLKFGNRPSN